MATEHNTHLETEPAVAVADHGEGIFTLGLAANYADTDETRFLLTPESCGMLTSSGIRVLMESDAGVDISFTDDDYAKFGVEITSREEALKADIVLSYLPPRAEDIMRMREGATLFCMMDSALFERKEIDALLERRITLGVFDNMYSSNEDPVFANIVDEIDGRAAILSAQDHLSFLGGGKGVLLAGVAGLNPCEVLVFGDGTKVYAAAKAALDSGAQVTLMNNDVSAMRNAIGYCGDRLSVLAIHPRVLTNKIKTADVIIIGSCTRPFKIPKSLGVAMKETVYMLDFEESHPSTCVPRTVAMALSNVLVNFFDEMIIKDGVDGMIASTPGVQCGIVTYRGKLVDKLIGSYLSMPSVDISVMLTAAN